MHPYIGRRGRVPDAMYAARTSFGCRSRFLRARSSRMAGTTRYDKHALIYRGGMVLASIVLWLNA